MALLAGLPKGWVGTAYASDAPETTDVRFRIIALPDNASIVMAEVIRFSEHHSEQFATSAQEVQAKPPPLHRQLFPVAPEVCPAAENKESYETTLFYFRRPHLRTRELEDRRRFGVLQPPLPRGVFRLVPAGNG